MHDGAGVGLKVVHQGLDRGRDGRTVVVVLVQAALGVKYGRDPFLQIEAKLVLTAARGQVQGQPQLQHEVDGLHQGFRLTGRHLTQFFQAGWGRGVKARLRGPPAYAQVTNATRPILEVGFEHEDSVAEARMPAILLLAQAHHQTVWPGSSHASLVARKKVGREMFVTNQEPGIEQSRGRGQILVRQA